jgi:hypothetical protein
LKLLVPHQSYHTIEELKGSKTVMNLSFFAPPKLYSNVMRLSSFVMSSWATELAAVVVAATQVVAIVVAANKFVAVVVMDLNWKLQSLSRQTQCPTCTIGRDSQHSFQVSIHHSLHGTPSCFYGS